MVIGLIRSNFQLTVTLHEVFRYLTSNPQGLIMPKHKKTLLH